MRQLIALTSVCLWAAVTPVGAQDSGTQQQIDKLTGQIQDINETLQRQDARLDALEKQVADLANKVSTPVVNDSASADDVKKLAAAIKEVDEKRLADRELILAQMQKLGKISVAAVESHAHHTATTAATGDTSQPPVPTTGYDYVVKEGDTIGSIARKYRAQGVKVTSTQILRANPGLNANALYVGKKIFIPDPNAK